MIRKHNMKRSRNLLLLAAMLTSTFSATAETKTVEAAHKRGVIDTSKSPYAKLRSIPMQDTQLTEGFWAERFELCADHMIPAMKKAMLGKGSAKLNRIKFMAGLTDTNPGGTPWGDGDNYKWIETMAHAYNLNKDPVLDRQMDEWIEIVGKAQEPDGYISTNIGHDKEARFKQVNLHEMYNMGHLLTAGCIHYRVTGKETFLNIARKNADFLCRQWKENPEQMARFPWNPSVYMGMAEIYRTTGNPGYLELLRKMIDNRGSRPNPDRDHRFGGTDQTQDRVPIRKETIAVGHAVTGNYFYCGAADLYAETGEKALLDALQRIWSDICEKKTDITCAVAMFKGGSTISPRGDSLHENFANKPYLQPNTYNETCANIATGMFNYRMLMLTGDAKYADWTERMMYNTLNSGVDIKGEKWFYCNPLSWDGGPGEMRRSKRGNTEALVPGHHTPVRWETNNCYCCPPSVARTTAKLHNWFYNISDDGALWINFYGGNKLSTTLADGSIIALTQTTDYPWDGRIEIKIDAVGSQPLSIHFRIPGWVQKPTVSLNGKPYNRDVEPGTYLEIRRTWSAADTVVLDFPMTVRLMEANPKVRKLHNKVAVMRGPIVYCMELPKRQGGEQTYVNGVFLPENAKFTAQHLADFLGGVTVLKGKALTFTGCEQFVKDNPGAETPLTTEDGALYQPIQPRSFKIPAKGTVELTLIPYYAWANRGVAYMDVWMPLATQYQLVRQAKVVAEIENRIAADKPNVLFIAVDDLRPELGCYGSDIAITPNLDRLAENGLLFERAYCQQAICSPSRASLMTGARPDTINVIENYTYFRDLNPDIVTLPQHLRANGYETVYMGKVFHGRFTDEELSWSRKPARAKVGFRPAGLAGGYALSENQEIFKNNKARMIAKYGEQARYGLGHGPAYECADVPDQTYMDGYNTDLAIATMKDMLETGDQPFFLGLGFMKPHLNWVAPKRYWDLYDPAKIPLATHEDGPENGAEMGLHASFELRVRYGIPKTGPIGPELAGKLRHAYLACVSYVDAQIGRMIAALEQAGVRDNTIIIVWGDHGWHLGEMGVWGKATNYEIATWVPLIIWTPDMPDRNRGKATDALVELVDIYPTLCDLAGIVSPGHLEGRSFAPLLDDPKRSWKSAAFSQFPSPALREWAANPLSPGMRETYFGPLIKDVEARIIAQQKDRWDRDLFENHLMGYAMRTDRHRLVVWKDQRRLEDRPIFVELYDHKTDPAETINIAEKKPVLVSRLLAQFSAGWKGSLPEPGEENSD